MQPKLDPLHTLATGQSNFAYAQSLPRCHSAGKVHLSLNTLGYLGASYYLQSPYQKEPIHLSNDFITITLKGTYLRAAAFYLLTSVFLIKDQGQLSWWLA